MLRGGTLHGGGMHGADAAHPNGAARGAPALHRDPTSRSLHSKATALSHGTEHAYPSPRH